MPKPYVTDDEFIALFKKHGPAETARILRSSNRAVASRRRRLENRYDMAIETPGMAVDSSYVTRAHARIDNGSVIIGSDAHYWPGVNSPAHRALVHLIGELKPSIVILNGDVVDGASISRHAPNGWQDIPTLKSELAEVTERTDEIRAAAKGAQLFWTRGNHDARFEARLALQAKEFQGVKGFTLKDQFPHWQFCVSLWLNNDVVVKHRFKGGIHATHNNTLWAGKTMVTGHLHSLKVTPFSDYGGTRWGVDTGTIADPNGEHASYDEDNPKNHRSGFAVLSFVGGKLLWPELVDVVDKDHVQFRGRVIKI